MSDERDRELDALPPEPPPTEEELAESKRLREALEGHGRDPVVEALRAAWSPVAIDARAHDVLLADVPTVDELASAAALRDALDADDLVVALRAAHAPSEIDPEAHRLLVARAVGTGSKVVPLRRRVIAPAVSVLAAAAVLVLWVGRPSEAPLAQSRSTQPLFDEAFKSGETSARIDRIAVARAADYRDNRFAKWGVK